MRLTFRLSQLKGLVKVNIKLPKLKSECGMFILFVESKHLISKSFVNILYLDSFICTFAFSNIILATTHVNICIKLY